MATIENPSPSRALPARMYRDPEVLELERERIFERTWQLAAHVSQISKPGTYLTAKVGTQPVLVVRDDEGELRAFRNVCRHRGSRLLEGSGECGKAIRCLYHGWTYRLDGELIGVPEARSIPGPRQVGAGLFPVRVETMAGLVFVNLDPHATPLADQVAGLPERWPPTRSSASSRTPRTTARQPANWKIAADNYLEGYHVPIAHPGLMRLLDYKRYDVEVHDNWVWFEAPLRDKPSGNLMERVYQRLVSPMPGLREEDRRVWRFVFIYPNTAIDLYPDLVWTWKMDADDPVTTRDTALLYRHPDASLRTRLAQRVNRKVNTIVGDEDFDLVKNVQAESRAGAGSPGRCPAARPPWPGSPTGSGRTWARTVSAAEPAPAEAPRPSRPRRPRADPRGGGGAHRERRHRRRADRAHRDGRGRVHLARALPLRDPRGPARAGARLLVRAGRRRSHRRGRGRCARPHAAAGRDGRPVPSLPGNARARLDPVGGALAAGGPPPRAAPHGRAPLCAHADVVRGRDRGGHGRGRVPHRRPPERIADRVLAMCDGFGVRALLTELSIERARTEVWTFLAQELGVEPR